MESNSWAESLLSNKPLNEVIADGVSSAQAANGSNSQAADPAQGDAAANKNQDLPQMHVGRGQRYGNLTWFPVFTDAPIKARDYVTVTEPGQVTVVEGSSPEVGFLEISNKGQMPVLLLEGTLLEGGWQHRALTRTVLIGANTNTALPVVCVEAGRWGGDHKQRIGVKTAPARVRKAIRGMRKNTDGTFLQSYADQSDVWHEVSNFATNTNKMRPTQSLVEMADEIAIDTAALKLEKPQPIFGQRGVLVAVAGSPLALEVFDHPDTLAERLESILDAYLPESLAKPYVACKSQLARDFVYRVETIGIEHTDVEERMRNRPDKYVAAEAVTSFGELLHISALNAQHELVSAL